MKKLFKTVLCTAVAVLLCAGLFTACRSKGKYDSSSYSSSSYSSSMDSSLADSDTDSVDSFDSSEGIDSGSDAQNDVVPDESDSISNTSGETLPTMAESTWSLVLVNETHVLDENYAPEVTAIAGSPKEFDARAVSYLNAMLAAAEADGCPCFVVSGYRSVQYQTGLFNRKVQSYLDQGLAQQDAETEAAKWVARPGTSEHNLGLAVDLVSGDWYLSHDDLTEDFKDTTQYAWLIEHGAEYGFILRYPENGEALTGVHYEPWHFRFVGERAAREIMEKGETLEEYLARENG